MTHLTAPSLQQLWRMAKSVAALVAEVASEEERDLLGDRSQSMDQSSQQSATFTHSNCQCH